MTDPTANGELGLEARQAIADLVVEHSWLIDHGFADRVPDLYTENASLLGIGEDLMGREAVAEWSRRRVAMRERTSRHVCTNLRVIADRSDRARGTVLVTLYRHDGEPAGPALPLLIGEFGDHYERGADGRWRFAERRFSSVFTS